MSGAGARRFVALSLVLPVIHLAAVATAQRPNARSEEPQRFLRSVGGFNASDFERLQRGEAVAKVLDTDRREVATVGAIRIRAPRARLVERYRDVSTRRGSNIVLELGTFGTPPRPEDLRSLTPEAYDLETIRDCTPGDCGVRVSAEVMARFSRDVNWQSADWQQQAGSLWRSVLAEYAAAYRATGALGEYRNKSAPLSVAAEFDLLFDESNYFAAGAPELFAYLKGFPRGRPAGAEDLLYWAKEDIGLRPITSITHQTVYTPPADGASPPRPAFIVTKQIYATHYFDAALGLTMAFEDDATGFYMVCINRARTRSLQSFTRAVVRSVVQRRSRDATERMLMSSKMALERPGNDR